MRTATLVSSLAVAATLALSGCAATPSQSQNQSDDEDTGYDLSERLKQRQASYCAETSPVVRAATLAVIRSQVPGYPVSGLCTDAEQALADEIAEQLADLPEGTTIDFEQAVEDQRRYQQTLED